MLRCAVMPISAADLEELRALLGADGVLATEAARFTYEADALALEKHMPDVVVLPRNSDEVAAVVRWARARKRYERHGILVTPNAIVRAEAECLADEERRARKRERAADRREAEDREYESAVLEKLKESML